MELVKTFRIESAHQLPSEGGKEARLHGHSFRIDVWVEGELDAELGWIVDFAEIKSAFQPVHQLLDHRLLNDVDGMDEPSAARIAEFIYQRMKPALACLSRVVVFETPARRGAYPAAEPSPTERLRSDLVAAL